MESVSGAKGSVGGPRSLTASLVAASPPAWHSGPSRGLDQGLPSAFSKRAPDVSSADADKERRRL